MAKPPRKGSFEELIFRRRRFLDQKQVERFAESFPVSDRTADQFSLQAVSSVEQAEHARFPWLKLRRRRTRA